MEPEWELSKENVQPLKQGRHISDLNAAFQPQNMDHIKKERDNFELEIRTYNGEDPMDVWHRYINWTEQNYPKGGKDSSLSKLLEQCVTKFKDDQRYKNDLRYLEAWIKFIKFCDQPLDIFQFMFTSQISSGLAEFYISWANELELRGNTKKADAIYNQGIQVGAQPLDHLRRKHQEYQMRVARNMTLGSEESNQDDMDSSEPQRAALGELRTKKKAPVNRASATKQGPSRGLGNDRAPLQQSNRAQTFQVFSDENAPLSVVALPPQGEGEWASIPTRSVGNRENEQQPGKWTNAKVKQKSVSVVPVSQVSAQGTPSFHIHQEENVDQAMMTPRKPILSDDKVLSARKETRVLDPFQHMQKKAAVQEKRKLDEVRMYSYQKIYAGVNEYSFEELRAAHCKKQRAKQEKERAQAERMRQELRQQMLEEQQLLQERQRMMEDEQRKLREQMEQERRQQLEEMQRLRLEMQQQQQQQLRLQEQELQSLKQRKAQMEEARTTDIGMCSTKIPTSAENMPQSSYSFSQPPGLQSRLTVPRPQQPHNISANNVSSTQFLTPTESFTRGTSELSSGGTGLSSGLTGLSSGSTGGLSSGTGLSISGYTPSSALSTSGILGVSSGGGSGGFTRGVPGSTGGSTRVAPNLSDLGAPRSGLPTPDTSSFTPRGSLTAPSPTVNTRDAMQAIYGMFNRTLDNAPFSQDEEQMNDSDACLEEKFAATSSNKTLGQTFVPRTSLVSGVPFSIFCDDDAASNADKENNDENKIPIGFPKPRQKGLASFMNTTVSVLNDENTKPDLDLSHVDMDEEDDEIISANNQNRNEENMEGIEGINYNDLTFAPKCSSTQNFSEMTRMARSFGQKAHLASTPFNPSVENSLPQYPFSAIKPSVESTQIEPPRVEPPVSTTFLTSGTESTFSTTTSVEPLKPPADAEHQQSTAGAPENPNVTHAVNPPRKSSSNLSPIYENSDEDTKSTTHSSQSSVDPNTLHSTHHHTTLGMSRHNGEELAPLREEVEENKTFHEIDVSCYVPAEDDVTTNLMSQSIMVAERGDPFDEDLIAKFLRSLNEPIETYDAYREIPEETPEFSPDTAIPIDGEIYQIKSKLGEGAYAEVFHAIRMVDVDEGDDICMKVQKPACPWEFYITTEIQKRLAQLSLSIDVSPSIMSIERGMFFSDGNVFINELHPYGTLLSLVNVHKQKGMKLRESLMTYLTIELLTIFDAMKQCRMIHGDVKPDNFLFRGFPLITDEAEVDTLFSGNTRALKLIDFGRSIDMNMFPRGTTFTAKVTTSGFSCIEMKTDRPWTYQTDLFGLIGTVHVLIFGQYMNVSCDGGQWRITKSVLRRWAAREVFQEMFQTLLNIPSCLELPDLSSFRQKLIHIFRTQMVKEYIDQSHAVQALLDS